MSEPKNSEATWEFVHRMDTLAIQKLKAELTDCKAEADRLKAEVERLNDAIVRGAIIPDPKPE